MCVPVRLQAARNVELKAATPVQGKDGSYGTSLALGTAQDPGCDVLLAYKQNGRRPGARPCALEHGVWALQLAARTWEVHLVL